MRVKTIIIPLILACHSQSAPSRGEGSKARLLIRHCEEPKAMWQSRANKKCWLAKQPPNKVGVLLSLDRRAPYSRSR